MPKTLYNRHVQWAKGVWRKVFETLAAAGGPPAEVLIDSTHNKAHRSAAGGKGGGSRPSHRLLAWRAQHQVPRSHRLTGSPARLRPDPRPSRRLQRCCGSADHLPPRCIVLADRAYDTNSVRQLIEAQGAASNIPSKVTRRWKSCFSPTLYKGRNAIERMFCRLKDFRRIHTRYDKIADNFLASVHLVAALTSWL